MLKCHIIAFALGAILDLIIGDPYCMPHPIRLIGKYIGFLDNKLLGNKNKSEKSQILSGLFLVVCVIFSTLVISSVLVFGAYYLNIYLGIFIETVLTFYCFAARCLQKESMKVYSALQKTDLEMSRYAVSMIVGRDTQCLDEAGIIKATVETVAENTSDGVIAPIIYTAIGGPVLGLLYKSINTMDSMIGYHNDRYEYFGRVAAHLDDIVNYIPARLSAVLMILASWILHFFNKRYDAKAALRVFKRDRYNHKSPNSAQTESVCAGALGLELAGDASYFGQIVHKPTIGDFLYTPQIDDIKRACALMYGTAALGFVIAISIMLSIVFLTGLG